MKNKLFIILALSYLFFPLALLAGSGSGNGGLDSYRIERGHAWFVGGKNVVHYCLSHAPQFGISVEKADMEIQRAIRTWKDYIVRKLGLEYSEQFLPTHYELQVCDGSEDVMFFLGTTSSQVEVEKKKYDNPIGFALMTGYDAKQQWGKGLVWIANSKSVHENFPDWTQDYMLRAVILHEMGHILGAAHTEGTVMDYNLGQWLQLLMKEPPSPVMSQIEFARELVYCANCPFDLKGEPRWSDEGFLFLTGRPPEGNVSYRAKGQGGSQQTPLGLSEHQSFVLEIEDSIGIYRFPVAFRATISRLFHPWQFILHQGFIPSTTVLVSALGESMVFMAEIIRNDGSQLPVIVMRNMPVEANYKDGMVFMDGILNILHVDTSTARRTLLFHTASDQTE